MSAIKKGMDETKIQIEELNSRIRNISSDMETIKKYLRDLRKTTLSKDVRDNDKAPMHLETSFSYLSSMGEPSEPPLGRTKEVVGKEMMNQNMLVEEEQMRGNKRDLQYQCLDLLLFNVEGALDWVLKVEKYFNMNCLMKQERLSTTSACIEGKTLYWLQLREK